MRGPIEENDHGIQRAVHSIRALVQQMNLLLGLQAMLWLQYEHEGHMDVAVHDLYETKLHNIESELTDILGRLVIEDLPF